MSSQTFELNNAIFRAGAGAGKTTKLVETLLNGAKGYKEQNGSWPKTVVCTFTRKATQELRERLFREVQKREDKELAQFVLNKSALTISTIDGILFRVLSQNAMHLGLPGQISFLDSSQKTRISKQVLREIIKNKIQYQDLVSVWGFHGLENIISQLAGVYFSYGDLKPLNLETMIDSLKSEKQSVKTVLSELISKISTEKLTDAWVSYLLWLQSILKSMDDVELLRATFCNKPARKPPQPKNNPFLSEDEENLLKSTIEQAESFSELAKTEEGCKLIFAQLSVLNQLAIEYSERLESKTIAKGLLIIRDLESLVLRLIRQKPELLYAYSANWDFWMIDEYQDTSPTQVQILEALSSNSKVFIVGDPQQSIYFFRGARSKVFNEKWLSAEFQATRGELTTNYRSVPSLLIGINEIVSTCKSQFQTMKPKSHDFDTDSSVIRVGLCDEQSPQIDFVDSEISRLVHQGIELHNICILAPQNSVLENFASELEAKGWPVQLHTSSGFVERRETQDLVAVLRFFLSPHDNQNLLEVLRSPWFLIDDQKIKEISEKATGKKSIWSVLNEVNFSDEELIAVARLRESLLRSKTDGLREGLVFAINDSGLLQLSHYHDVMGQREANIWKFLEMLRVESRKPGYNPHSFLKNMGSVSSLEDLDSESDATPVFEPSRLNLMTIHASKGLQFDHVFLPNLDVAKRTGFAKSKPYFDEETHRWVIDLPIGLDGEKQKPIDLDKLMDKEAAELLSEFDRLMYVALTRAKKTLHLSFKNSQKKPAKDSPAVRFQFPWTQSRNLEQYKVESLVPPFASYDKLEQNLYLTSALREPYKQAQTDVMRRLSVSKILELINSEFVINENKTSLLDKIQFARRGVEIHKLFELTKTSSTEEIRNSLFFKSNQFQSDLNLAIEFLLKETEIKLIDLIKNGQTEWGFITKLGNTRIEGQIDLWAIRDNKVWVVDYKTGSPKSYKKAFEQLKIYSLALHKVFGYQSFQLAVVFPMHNIIHQAEFNELAEIEDRIIKM